MSSVARIFAKPGWVITAVAVIAFTYVAFTVLAPWQLGKNARTSERNANIEAAFDRAPVPAAEALSPTGALTQPEWTRVTAQGTFDPDPAHTVLVRLRPIAGEQAYQVLTPMQVDGLDTPLVVNRGYVPAVTGRAPEFDAPPSGVVRVEGFVRVSEPVPSTAPVERFGVWQVAGLSMAQFTDVTGVTVGADYLQAAQDQPGVLTAVPLPQLEPGPYLSYGIQWIAFGIMAPLGLLYFVRAELRERRQEEQDRAAAAATTTNTAATSATANASTTTTTTATTTTAQAQAQDQGDDPAQSTSSAAEAESPAAAGATSPVEQHATSQATPTAPAAETNEATPTEGAAAPSRSASRRRARYGQRRDHFAKAFEEEERF